VTCHDAREQLSALLDDALSAPEREALGAHLAGCAECRRELEQLRATVALLGRLPPVHAPAGFVDRVMAQAYRPSWPRRLVDALFRPLRVKLPIEAAAVLLVGVSALYVYQHTPEVRQLAREETRESPPAPIVAPPPPAAPPAAGVGGEESRVRDLAPEAKRAPGEQGAAREKARQAPPAVAPPATPAPPAPTTQGATVQEAPAAKSETMPGARPEPQLEPKLEPELEPKLKKEAQVERRPDAGGATGTPSATGRVAQSAEPSPSRDAAGAGASTTASPAPTAGPLASAPAPAPETSGRVGGVAAAPATEGTRDEALSKARSGVATRLMRAVDASGRLVVPAREPAEAALDALLRRLGATRVARRLEGAQNMVLIDVVVPAARYRELVEGLGRIGQWTTEHELKTLPPQVRVEVALTVEP
jgi:Putative zinc-finger